MKGSRCTLKVTIVNFGISTLDLIANAFDLNNTYHCKFVYQSLFNHRLLWMWTWPGVKENGFIVMIPHRLNPIPNSTNVLHCSANEWQNILIVNLIWSVRFHCNTVQNKYGEAVSNFCNLPNDRSSQDLLLRIMWPDMSPPPPPVNFCFHFHAVFGKIMPDNILAPPLRLTPHASEKP